MYKLKLSLWACLISGILTAQDVQQLRDSARDLQRKGDYENAVQALNKALEQEPNNTGVKKDLAITYYLSRQYPKAIEVIKPLTEDSDADEEIFQIACLAYRGDLNFKEADRLYKIALKKYPESGMMYSEYGILLEAKDPGMGNGILQWEKGIEMDPGYSGNYYNAAKYYADHNNQLKAALYGEIFANIESYSGRTTEIKDILFDMYKKIFNSGQVSIKGTNAFETRVVESLKKQADLSTDGINTESLTAIRTRFILDWFPGAVKKYPYKLFELHHQLLENGLFEAYNQWLFGSVDNMPAYQDWKNSHVAEFNEFNKFQRNRVFKVPAGQYYK